MIRFFSASPFNQPVAPVGRVHRLGCKIKVARLQRDCQAVAHERCKTSVAKRCKIVKVTYRVLSLTTAQLLVPLIRGKNWEWNMMNRHGSETVIAIATRIVMYFVKIIDCEGLTSTFLAANKI